MKTPEGMAEFTALIDGNKLRAWIESLTSIVDECKLVVSRSGFHVKAVDPAHVCMMEVKLNRASFTKLVVSNKGSVGLDLDRMVEVLKATKKGSEVKFEVKVDSELEGKEGQGRRARVYNQTIIMKLDTITRQFKPVNTEGMSEPKIPKLNLPGKFTIDYDTWEQSLKQVKHVSDHVVLMMSKKRRLFINGEGDNDKVVNEIEYDLLDNVKGVTSNFRSLFPEDYLRQTIKQGSMKRLLKGNPLTMHMGDDYPLKVLAETDEWEFTYLLAPRIESE